MYPKDFEKAFAFLLKWEGGYVYDPRDPGGETKFGISKKAYPFLDIKNLTENDAKEIYYNDYWTPLKCNYLPFPVNICLFDTGVNVGIKRASKFLQKAINQLTNAKLTVDGIIGPKTLNSASMCNPYQLATHLIKERVKFYAHSKLDHFKNGWINRSFDLIDKFVRREG